MKREIAINLLNSLFDKTLKPKTLSTDTYFSVHQIKVKLKNYLLEMADAEKNILDDYSFEEFPPETKENKDFWEKIRKVQEPEIKIDKLNFIDIEEYRKWTEDAPNNIDFILAQNLLKIE